jgi:uncharacterized hydantoinase/oxoprolinase family protein
MKVKELFDRVGDPSFVMGDPLFDREACTIKSIAVDGSVDGAAIIILKDQSGTEWRAYLRVLKKFNKISSILLNWVQTNQDILGLTLNQLEDVETGLI